MILFAFIFFLCPSSSFSSSITMCLIVFFFLPFPLSKRASLSKTEMCFCCWRLLWAQESQSVVILFELPVFVFFLNIQERMYFLYVSANHTFTGWVCNWSTPAVVLAASGSPHTEGGGVCASTTPRVWSNGFGRGVGGDKRGRGAAILSCCIDYCKFIIGESKNRLIFVFRE